MCMKSEKSVYRLINHLILRLFVRSAREAAISVPINFHYEDPLHNKQLCTK